MFLDTSTKNTQYKLNTERTEKLHWGSLPSSLGGYAIVEQGAGFRAGDTPGVGMAENKL